MPSGVTAMLPDIGTDGIHDARPPPRLAASANDRGLPLEAGCRGGLVDDDVAEALLLLAAGGKGSVHNTLHAQIALAFVAADILEQDHARAFYARIHYDERVTLCEGVDRRAGQDVVVSRRTLRSLGSLRAYRSLRPDG